MCVGGGGGGEVTEGQGKAHGDDRETQQWRAVSGKTKQTQGK